MQSAALMYGTANQSAIKNDPFAADRRKEKIDRLGDPLAEMEEHVDFMALAAELDRGAPRLVSPPGGRPPFPTETMIRGRSTDRSLHST